MSAQSALCPVHIGREAEVQRLKEAAKTRTMILVAGEAGVGKSRLASEAVRLAEEQGLARLVGYCTADAGVPYAPVVTALRRRTRTLHSDELAQLFDGPASLASVLLPEAARAVGLPADMASKEEDLFAAVWQLLARLSAPSGGLLLLEDLHWADTDSLRLLSYLARETTGLDVWLVGTYRSDELHRRHPLTPVLAELGRERRYTEIRLEPLRRDELRRMVSAILDDTGVGDEFLDAVHEHTEGNPFFVEELIKVFLDQGDIFRKEGDWARRDLAEIEMPVTVRETLLARARTLSPDALRALATAALAGDRLDLPVIAEASGLGEPALSALVSDGLSRQLLVERRDGPVTFYAFRHALTREAFAEELVGPERQRAHLRIAEGLQRVHAADLDPVAAKLADHYAQAGVIGPAIEFGIRAARFAAASHAMEEAGRLYERTLRLMALDSAERLPLLIEAAEALVDGPDPRLVTSFATEARQLAHARADPLSEGLALSTLQRKVWDSGGTAEALSMARQARDLVSGHGDWEEALVESRLVRMLVLAGQQDEARSRLAAAIELTERAGNLRALSMLHGTSFMLASYGPEAGRSYEAAAEAARRAGDTTAETNLVTNVGYVSLWCGDFTRARRHLVQAMELSERFAPSRRYAKAGFAWLLSLTGLYDEAWTSAQSIVNVADVPSKIVALCALCEVAERRGAAEAAGLVGELYASAARTGEAQRMVPAQAARARHALIHDGLEVAIPLFWEVLKGTTSPSGRGGSHWMFSPDLARGLSDEGQLVELDRWCGAVHQLTIDDPNPHNVAADELCLAHAAAARGSFDRARASFARAAALYEAMPCPARHVEALLGLVELEWSSDPSQPSTAAARQALVTAAAIGADTLVARAQRAADRAEAPPILATVMFTDIVGSTERLAKVGDKAWRSLLERHNRLVRRELAHWRGHEIETTGDGFLAWFDTPAQGIRCALGIRDALAAAGITLRAGLHTGECQVSGDHLTGIAVHIAARVSALGGPGDVLVSRTVRDLVAGSGFSLADRGMHQLKGVSGEWQVFAVTA